ncbi:MAG: hypothetical protein R6W48_12550 [Gaiellaceae bacterium]
MSGTMASNRPPSSWRRGFSLERLMWIEVLVLAPLAAILVLLVIPSWFQIDWGCISTTGVTRTPGDTYITTFGVLGTLGWLVVVMAALFANITGSNRVASILPIAWFTTLVLAALVTAAAIGPQLCS